jgi:hypothetical protein
MKTKNDNNQPTIRKIARIRDDATGHRLHDRAP